jgi:hypothetical protein
VPADRGTETTPVRTRIVALAVLASVLATCLFALPLGWAVRAHMLAETGANTGYALRGERLIAFRRARVFRAVPPTLSHLQLA